MGDRVQELQADLRSGDQDTIESAAKGLFKIADTDPERISPAIEQLQSVAQSGPRATRGTALSVLGEYGGKVDRSVLETVEDSIFDLLQDSEFNQQNALIAVTALGSRRFAGVVKELIGDSNTRTASMATLAYVRVTNSDFEWLPITQEHVRCVMRDGKSVFREEYPEYLLYFMDARCSESGQRVSTLHQIQNIRDLSAEFAMTAAQFINEYPEERLSSLHVGALSAVAKEQPQPVVEVLELSEDKVKKTSNQKRRQYMWTLANAAEADPQVIGEDIITIARGVVEDSDPYSAEQAIRLLGAIHDTGSVCRIEERMDGGHPKVQSAGRDALTKLRNVSEETDNTGDEVEHIGNEGGGEPVAGSAVSGKQAGKLAELRERAEEAARDDPVREQVTSTASQYHRSTPVKQYAKARADGVCECCGESAPFTDMDGEPYLEVHHVDELGEGGADRPDRVVAVCPTCHKRIHYGEDGEDVNNRLKEQLTSGSVR